MMDIDKFPDRPRRKDSPIPPATIRNVQFLLDQNGIKCRYNEIKKKVELDIPGHAGTAENLDEVTFIKIKSLCAEHGMPTGSTGEYVNAIADQHAYNPVADWIRSRPWDGKDRLPEIEATVITQPDYSVHLKSVLLRKWLRSAAAAALVRNYKGRGVLTSQGPQGIGKTSWVKALVNALALRDSVIKLDHHLDSSNKDSLLGAIDNWIVEIGELDSSFKKDVARLKGFITSDSDRVRRPYARNQSEYPRRTLFVATVNDPNFLIDTTGNSRWWTIAVDRLDFRHAVDMQQLFAQMAVEVESGGEWWLNEDEEALLAEWNSRHVATSVVADSVTKWLDLDPDYKGSPNPMLAPIVTLLLLTGCRKRELLDAKWDQFDLERKSWRIPMSKSGKARHVPLSDEALKVLEALPRFPRCPYVVPNVKTLKPHTAIYNAWNTARRKAGLADVRMHDCRHTLASHLAMSGHSLLIISKVLGHNSTRTTERYAHVSNDALRDAVNIAAKVSGTTWTLPSA